MNKKDTSNSALPTLGDIVRPSISINKEIVSATNAADLGNLFDTSFNARVGVLSKNANELERLTEIAEKLLTIIPKEKLPFVNFIIVDNEMDLRNEVFATPNQSKTTITEAQRNILQQSALLFVQQVIQKGCITYAGYKNKDWNRDELRNELEKMKEFVARSAVSDEVDSKQNKPAKQLLFSKKKGIDAELEKTGNLKYSKESEQDKEERGKLLFTTPRARENSLPNELVKAIIDGPQPQHYSFLDLLAADGYETQDLETFEEQVILKLDKLKEHILQQFNPVFNELNIVRKRLRHLAEQTTLKKNDRKSIMKDK